MGLGARFRSTEQLTNLDTAGNEIFAGSFDIGNDQVEIAKMCRVTLSLLRRRLDRLFGHEPHAVRVLKAKGLHVMRLEEGVPEWRVRGLPVAGGDEPELRSFCVNRASRNQRAKNMSKTVVVLGGHRQGIVRWSAVLF